MSASVTKCNQSVTSPTQGRFEEIQRLLPKKHTNCLKNELFDLFGDLSTMISPLHFGYTFVTPVSFSLHNLIDSWKWLYIFCFNCHRQQTARFFESVTRCNQSVTDFFASVTSCIQSVTTFWIVWAKCNRFSGSVTRCNRFFGKCNQSVTSVTKV